MRTRYKVGTVMRDYQLLLLTLPGLIYLLIFNYLPMYGAVIAFKDYSLVRGIAESPWVGFSHFSRFFSSFQFWNLIRNTLGLSVFQLLAGFPVPIVLALLLNQMRSKLFRSVVQTMSYAPHFISVVVVVGMLTMFLSPRTGIVNIALEALGLERIHFMARPQLFKPIYVISGIWQSSGWASIIYLAALSSVSPELYEASKVDGATKLQQIRHIDIPSLMPTATIMLILSIGRLMNVGMQKAYLMQNPLTANSQEIIQTYVYKIGMISQQFSYSTAIGLFNSAVNAFLLVTVNRVVRQVSESSLW